MKTTEDKKMKTDYNLLAWFKFIVGLLFSGLVMYKLAVSDLEFDFSKFDFNALLALILAMFAISLSVVFYFKATDTSNLFYDNTYKFTKEISEILGRIEAGFGERLKHLDEGYSGLMDRMDGKSRNKNIEETKEEIEKEKDKLKQDIKERNKILENLLEKAQLEAHEKEEIIKQLGDKEKEIRRQNKELNFLKNSLTESDSDEINFSDIPESVMQYMVKHASNIENPQQIFGYPISISSKRFRFKTEELSNRANHILRKYRMIEENGDLTVHGIKVIRKIVELNGFV